MDIREILLAQMRQQDAQMMKERQEEAEKASDDAKNRLSVWESFTTPQKQEVLFDLLYQVHIKKIKDPVTIGIIRERLIDFFNTLQKNSRLDYTMPQKKYPVLPDEFKDMIPNSFLDQDVISQFLTIRDLKIRALNNPDIYKTLSEESRIRLLIDHTLEKKAIDMEFFGKVFSTDENYDKEYRMKLIGATIAYYLHPEEQERYSYIMLLFARELFSHIVEQYMTKEQLDVYTRPMFGLCRYNASDAHFCEMYWKLTTYKPEQSETPRCPKGDYLPVCETVEYRAPYIQFLKALDIHPYLLSEKEQVIAPMRPEAFYFRICGWMNQYLSMRDHLSCKCCGKPVQFNYLFSKSESMAVYLQTVAKCVNPDCEKYEQEFYLSHCWHCGHPIDSMRDHDNDRRLQYRGYWLCNYCGAGRFGDKYFIGTMCPSCGASLKSVPWKKEYGKGTVFYQKTCPACGHQIRNR